MHGGDVYRNSVELDFSVNVNPFGVPEGVREALVRSLSHIEKYPDMECMELKAGLAEKLHVSSEQIICGNGASELIAALCRWRKPVKALLLAPGFSGYQKALEAVDCELVYFALSESVEYQILESGQDIDSKQGSLEALLECIEITKPDIFFLANPQNPTGKITDRKALKKILEHCERADTSLVVDECFIELVTAKECQSMILEVSNYKNLFVLRAFTKSFAIPGVRLGYLISGSRDLAKEVERELPEWNVSIPAQYAGVASLKEDEYLLESVEYIAKQRAYLESELAGLGLRVYSSMANYILFFYAGVDLYKALLERGILIRDCSDYNGLGQGYYRIAVRKQEENEQLIKALKITLMKSNL